MPGNQGSDLPLLPSPTSCPHVSWRRQLTAQGLGPLLPMQGTWAEVPAPGCSLAQPGCRGHLESEPADGRAPTLFQINTFSKILKSKNTPPGPRPGCARPGLPGCSAPGGCPAHHLAPAPLQAEPQCPPPARLDVWARRCGGGLSSPPQFSVEETSRSPSTLSARPRELSCGRGSSPFTPWAGAGHPCGHHALGF